MKVFGVTGWKNSGKTGLMERLLAEFVSRGLSVSTLKHAHHSFDVDQPGRDSHKHREAGASQVLVSSGQRWALMSELRGAEEPSLDMLITQLAPVDLVLIEGWKSAPHAKIECFRAEEGHALLAPVNSSVRAIAADCDVVADVPVLALDDTRAIADFIAHEVGL
ncbi:MAG: molybdopterin-guanine dinucleotide biosynthesis protein B [Pseudomonadota bacterium]